MNKYNYTYEQIDKYLNGGLEGEALQSFENELQNNTELQEAVNNHRLANDLVIENRLQEVSGILQQTHKHAYRQKIWKKAAMGTIAAAGLVTGIILFNNKEEPESPEKDPQITQTQKGPENRNKTEAPDNVKTPHKPASETPEKVQKEKAIPSDKEEAPTRNKNIPVAQKTGDTLSKEQQEPDTTHPAGHSIKPVSDSSKNTENVLVEHNDHNTTNSQKDTAETPTSKNSTQSPCTDVHITANVTTKEACKGGQNGQIEISNIKGGTPPYEVIPANNIKSLTNLESGRYAIYIKDSGNCTDTIKDINVEAKSCFNQTSFNPFTGEKWEHPAHNAAGELIIYNQNGNVYFKKQIPAGTKATWKGRSDNGKLRTGYFIYKIKYSDGTVKKGSITIVK